MDIRFKKLNDAAVMPKAAHPGDALDLCAVAEVILQPNVPTLVKTGWAIEMPPDVRAWVTPRSGLALKHGLTVANAPGLIDPAYRGEIGVILIWSGHKPTHSFWMNAILPVDDFRSIERRYHRAFALDAYGSVEADGYQEMVELSDRATEDYFAMPRYARYRIAAGDRIAQLSFAQILAFNVIEAAELSETARAEGGFGSTGK